MLVTHIEEVAKHTVSVTDAMFGAKHAVPVSQPTIYQTLEMAKELEKAINYHQENSGSLDAAMMSIADVISSLEYHIGDIEKGIE